MNIKEKAFALFQSGKSYKEIAVELKIGKTTAFDYVKEIKIIRKSNPLFGVVPNNSERNSNVDSERNSEQVLPKVLKTIQNLKTINKTAIPNVPNEKKLKVFTGNELLKVQFEVFEFNGKFEQLIGKPEKGFSGLIFGKPKEGKSNFAIRLADYLQEYFGNTLYVAAEEGRSYTLQDKIKELKGSNISIIESRNREQIREFIKSNPYDFVFIDSINVAQIDDLFLELLKEENPKTSFIAIVQATKEGNFRGAQSLEHNCDFVIRVEKGVAFHKGRFGPESELAFFDENLFKKNPLKKIEEKIMEEKPMSLPLPNAFRKVEHQPKLSELKLILDSPNLTSTPSNILPFNRIINPINPIEKNMTKNDNSNLGKAVLFIIGGVILSNLFDEN